MGGSHYPVPIGSEVIVRTGGGGGWGDPLERDPAAVRTMCRRDWSRPRRRASTTGSRCTAT